MNLDLPSLTGISSKDLANGCFPCQRMNTCKGKCCNIALMAAISLGSKIFKDNASSVVENHIDETSFFLSKY